MQMITTASIIGTGNVATHLALSLKELGVTIEHVVGRDFQRAEILADRVGAVAKIEMQDILSQLLIISVSDDSYAEVISKLNLDESTIVVHTSGSIPMSIFKKKFKNYGVFYPLQTFTLDRPVQMERVPFCIEGSSGRVVNLLTNLAGQLSKDVRHIDSMKRQQIHIAAVFCSNFVNFLYDSANELLKECHVPLDILYPLIMETAEKAITMGPENAQTGPAKRGDLLLVDKHLSKIENPKLKELYLLLSDQIINKYNS
jgi:predicted short-subunit dehydrogenase-like oxidoreductase (DUF2520 family)